MTPHRRNTPYCGMCWNGRCVFDSTGKELTEKQLERLEKKEREWTKQRTERR